MFTIALHNLSRDLDQVGPDLGHLALGTMSPDELISLLNRFSLLRAQDVDAANPRIDIWAPSGNYFVRTLSGKLFLYDVADPSRTSTELSAAEIVNIISRPAPSSLGIGEDDANKSQKSARFFGSKGISFVMLIVGLALNGYTLYAAFYIVDVNQAPPLTLITAKDDLARQREILAGTFITGTEPGDRAIIINTDGAIKLLEYGSAKSIRRESSHTTLIGRRNQTIIVAVKPKGQIEVSNRDTLLFYGDTYRRIEN